MEFHARRSAKTEKIEVQMMIVEGPQSAALATWIERDHELICVSAPKTVEFMLNKNLDDAKVELTKRGMIWSWPNRN